MGSPIAAEGDIGGAVIRRPPKAGQRGSSRSSFPFRGTRHVSDRTRQHTDLDGQQPQLHPPGVQPPRIPPLGRRVDPRLGEGLPACAEETGDAIARVAAAVLPELLPRLRRLRRARSRRHAVPVRRRAPFYRTAPSRERMAEVTIRYCSPCRYLPKAIQDADAILKEFGESLSALRLVPGDHGVYDVAVDDTAGFSLEKTNRFPEPTTLIQTVRTRVNHSKPRTKALYSPSCVVIEPSND